MQTHCIYIVIYNSNTPPILYIDYLRICFDGSSASCGNWAEQGGRARERSDHKNKNSVTYSVITLLCNRNPKKILEKRTQK